MSDAPFRITKVIDGATFYYDAVGATWEVSYGTEAGPYLPSNNWIKLGATNNFLSEERLDLAGLSMQELTLMFANQRIQRSGPYVSTVTIDPAQGGALIIDSFVVSDVPLGAADTFTPLGQGPNSIQAGFNNSPDEFINTKLAIGSSWTQSTTSPLVMLSSDNWEYGSGDPTASDMLYLYRWVQLTVPGPSGSDACQVPSIRYTATGMTTKESDTVYINRLRLSYEQVQRT
ncbi:MAG: hypothetical protein [Circular genetic element sp.]|nr:MAG: hypothetical protein [Circular genetic element sp.]